LPFGYIRTPSLPVGRALAVGLEALLFFAEVLLVLNEDHGGCGGCGGWRCMGRKLVMGTREAYNGGVGWMRKVQVGKQ
jgi:hypothetical protein